MAEKENYTTPGQGEFEHLLHYFKGLFQPRQFCDLSVWPVSLE